MKTLRQKHHDELRGRLASLSRVLCLQWPFPAEARDEEVAITAYPEWPEGQRVLSVTVACSLRLLPVLREFGYGWVLRQAGTGEEVAADQVVGRLGFEVPDLAEGEYTLEVALQQLSLRRKPLEWRLPPSSRAAKSSSGPKPGGVSYEVVQPFHSPEEDAATGGMITGELRLRRSANNVLTLWIKVSGGAAEGQLARFTLQSAAEGAGWQTSGFLGIDKTGVGEINLSAFDDDLERNLRQGCSLAVEFRGAEDLQADDCSELERSRAAAIAGRESLDAALVQRLQDEEAPTAVRAECARALGRIGGAEALAALRERLHDPDTPEVVREACTKALDQGAAGPLN